MGTIKQFGNGYIQENVNTTRCHCAGYGVPVLYFTANTVEEARPLSAAELWESMPPEMKAITEQRDTLTQAEHPVLGVPLFQLHPCRTAELMKQMLSTVSPGCYLRSWISLVGGVVGLSLPLSYYYSCSDAGLPGAAPAVKLELGSPGVRG